MAFTREVPPGQAALCGTRKARVALLNLAGSPATGAGVCEIAPAVALEAPRCSAHVTRCASIREFSALRRNRPVNIGSCAARMCAHRSRRGLGPRISEASGSLEHRTTASLAFEHVTLSSGSIDRAATREARFFSHRNSRDPCDIVDIARATLRRRDDDRVN